jgi:hypothetical protein
MHVLFFIALDENGKHCETPELKQPKEKPCLPSVSSALVLGATLGLGEALVLLFLVGPILTVMGVDEVSPHVILSVFVLCDLFHGTRFFFYTSLKCDGALVIAVVANATTSCSVSDVESSRCSCCGGFTGYSGCFQRF